MEEGEVKLNGNNKATERLRTSINEVSFSRQTAFKEALGTFPGFAYKRHSEADRRSSNHSFDL